MICYKIKLKSYYNKIIKKADKIVLPIGMLKFSSQNFSYVFDLITKIAEKYNKPILMSAMSIANPDENDLRYIQLKNAINRSSVWGITTRDGVDGLERLRKYYLTNEKIFSDYVGDPALWIPEVYGFDKTMKTHERKIIGVNLIRKGIYASYKEEVFSEEQLLSFYKELVKELEKRNYQWEFFCNGMNEDYQVGKEILSTLGLPLTKLAPIPSNADEYVNIVNKYNAVLGARLHSCITSVSLDIPVSGLLWDNKLHYFSKTMGIRHLFSTVKELKANLVVDKIESAISNRIDIENRDHYKNKTLSSIKKFIEI